MEEILKQAEAGVYKRELVCGCTGAGKIFNIFCGAISMPEAEMGE